MDSEEQAYTIERILFSYRCFLLKDIVPPDYKPMDCIEAVKRIMKLFYPDKDFNRIYK